VLPDSRVLSSNAQRTIQLTQLEIDTKTPQAEKAEVVLVVLVKKARAAKKRPDPRRRDPLAKKRRHPKTKVCIIPSHPHPGM
jgi:hypothetical protein